MKCCVTHAACFQHLKKLKIKSEMLGVQWLTFDRRLNNELRQSFRCVMICGRLNTLITSCSGCGGCRSSRVIDGPMSMSTLFSFSIKEIITGNTIYTQN